MSKLSNALARALKRVRGENSQSWLAEQLGVSRVTINRWENGHGGDCDLKKLERLIDLSGVSLANLFGLPGATEPSPEDAIRILEAFVKTHRP